ncbi:MAG: calcium-translocating P-type ATPase, SERCA-type [Candidatus Woesearchaeota archaeon]
MYYNLGKEEVLRKLDTSEKGLSDREVSARLRKYGKNVIKRKHKINPVVLFLKQFLDPLVIILLIVTIVSFFLGEYLDSVVILAILLINAIIGFANEYKAEKSIELLQKLTALHSRVLRDGKEKIIPASNLVPGDIIVFESGDRIGADVRVIQQSNLGLDEAILTGESTPVNKQLHAIGHHCEKIIVAEQSNMVFKGTTVVSGRGKGVVVSTGMNTEMGKIAELVQEVVSVKTPLQKRLKKLGHKLTVGAVFISVLVFSIGIFREMGIFNMFKTAIALAVAVVPEGLPAVVTVSLAIGVRRMSKRHALVRKLRAVETLGSTRVICSDKTGTITKNEMTVRKIFAHGKMFGVTGVGYGVRGSFLYKGKEVNSHSLHNMFNVAASCNNSALPNIGDPTELALLVLAKKGGVNKIEERVREFPFDAKEKYMSTTHRIHGEEVTFLKGAPEKILGFCDYIEIGEKIIKLDKKGKEKVLDKNHEMTLEALRVLGLAYKKHDKAVFLGLAGMIDPPRKEIKNAIKVAHKAGIRVIMITGDHQNTAKAIANKVGIAGDVMEGKDLTKEKLGRVINKVNIFARVDPEHKVMILDVLQKKGEVVAMTGDGVNDAPALKKADVGIAMGIKGTDVARDTSDIVLADDNFASIVKAVKEGRIIYDNIKKFVKFLLSANMGEVGIIVVSLLLGMPLPLLPLQLLWINLVTDGLPALALGVDNSNVDVMKRKPREKKETILKGTYGFIFIAAIIATVVMLGLFKYNLKDGVMEARTVVLTALILFELFLAFSCRSETSVFKLKVNKWLWGGVILSVLLHLTIMYTPLNAAFQLVPLGIADWFWIVLFSSLGFVFFEVKKLIWHS